MQGVRGVAMLKIVSLWTEVKEKELCMGSERQGPLKPEAQKATKEQGAQTQGLVCKEMTGVVA